MIDINDKNTQLALISGIVGGSILTLCGLELNKNVNTKVSKCSKNNIPTIISVSDMNELYDNLEKKNTNYIVGGRKKSQKKRNITKKRSQKKR